MAASTRSIACAPARRPPRASKSSSRRSCRQDRKATPARCTRTIPSGRARSATGHRNGSTASNIGSRRQGRSSAHAPALVSLDSAGTVPKRSNDACINFSPLPTWRFSRGGRGALRASGAPTPAPARNRHWPHGGAPAVRLRNPFGRKPKEFPSHLWTQCPNCAEMLFNKQLARNLNVCTKCGHHFKLGAAERVELLAEPGALIGFSGARVTSETIGEKLPKGYQRAEFQLQHGFVDQVVPRAQLKERIAFFLNAFRIAGQDMRWSL